MQDQPLAPPCCTSCEEDVALLSLPLDEETLVNFLTTEGKDVGKRFLGWARRNSISRHDARDAIQDFLLAIVIRLRTNEATRQDMSVGRVVLCGKRDAIRKHLRSQSVLPPDWVDDHPVIDGQDDLLTAMLAVLPTALARLSEEDRGLITFCDLEGGNESVKAQELGVHQGTVSRRLQKARMRLRAEIVAALEREGFDPDELQG